MGKSFAGRSVELIGHDCAVVDAAFDRDASRVVTASCDGTARIWDTATGEPLSVLRGHPGEVWSVAWSPDDRLVFTSDAGGDIRVYYADFEDLLALARARFVRAPRR